MHDMAESLDIHQGNNLHAFRKAYTTQIVTRQIDEHDVFAAFFRIRQQILGELLVLLNGGATWSGTRDREGHGMTAIHFDQRFRAGANDIEITSLRVSQRHEIHVRTGVQRTQYTIDVERIGRRIDVETLGNNHLKHVTVDNMPLGDFDRTLIIAFLRAEAEFRLANGLIQHVDASFTFDRRSSLSLHIVQSRHGLIICGVGTSRAVVHIHRVSDHPHRSGHMVDHGYICG